MGVSVAEDQLAGLAEDGVVVRDHRVHEEQIHQVPEPFVLLARPRRKGHAVQLLRNVEAKRQAWQLGWSADAEIVGQCDGIDPFDVHLTGLETPHDRVLFAALHPPMDERDTTSRQHARLELCGRCRGGAQPRRLGRLLHEGTYPARLLGTLPEAADTLRAPESPAPLPEDAIDRVLDDAASSGLAEALGRLRTTEYVRLAAREIENAPLEEVGRDLSTLVAVCGQACLRHEGIAERVCALGMGKLVSSRSASVASNDQRALASAARTSRPSSRGA